MTDAFAKNVATSVAASRVHDYWRIDCLEEPTGRFAIELRGRRRCSEAYWRPLCLADDQVPALAHALRDAVAVAAGFAAEPSACCPVFPETHVLAVCASPRYAIEIVETLDGGLRRSIDTVLHALELRPRPCLYLVGDELSRFTDDIAEVADALAKNQPAAIGAAP